MGYRLKFTQHEPLGCILFSGNIFLIFNIWPSDLSQRNSFIKVCAPFVKWHTAGIYIQTIAMPIKSQTFGEFCYISWLLHMDYVSLLVSTASREIKISIISTDWYDEGSWNPFSWKTRAFLLYLVNIMGADHLATTGHQHAWHWPVKPG